MVVMVNGNASRGGEGVREGAWRADGRALPVSVQASERRWYANGPTNTLTDGRWGCLCRQVSLRL